VGDGVTADIIRNYVETQGTKEEKDAYKQMNLLECIRRLNFDPPI
jgi:putative transposase